MTMDMDYDQQLSYTASMLFESSMAVATHLPGLSGLTNETLWTLQGEVLWTLTGYVIRDFANQYNPGAREAIEEEFLPIVISVMLARIFNWQEGTDEAQMSQHESFLYWFDEAEIGANQTTGFAMSEEAIAAMAETGQIPGDTYVARLCMRVARAVQQDGKSELIQGLARSTAEAYASSGFAELATNLATARRELTTAMVDGEDSDEGESTDPEAPAPQ